MSCLNKNISDYLIASESEEKIILKCDEMDDYDLPTEDNLPEDCYASIIMGLRSYRDKYKNHYVDVCYKMFPLRLMDLWNNEKIDVINYFYVRYRCLIGSDEERIFRRNMNKLYNRKFLTDDQLVGTCELFRIEYGKDNEILFPERRFCDLDVSWFEDDISDEFHRSAGYTLP